MIPIPGRFELVRVGDAGRSTANDRTFRRAVDRGDLVRVRRGVFLQAARWRELQPLDQYRLTIAAAVERAPALIVSHRSAAVLWGVPLIGAVPAEVEVLTSLGNGSRREGGFRRWASTDHETEIVEVDGIRVTSLRRTVVDLAGSLPFPEAVAAVDWGLAGGLPRDQLTRLAMALRSGGVLKRAGAAIGFADARAGSPGESVSRALIHQLGFPAPELQVPFYDRRGLIGESDFYWRRWTLIGEFDGMVKYQDERMLRGRTPAQVLAAEKRREDRLRATGPRVARWVWQDLTPGRLGPLLFDAGLPLLR
jgi:hypothetical protein